MAQSHDPAQQSRLERLRHLLAQEMAGLSADDLRFLRENGTLFAPQRQAIQTALEAWLSDEGRLEADDPPWVPAPQGDWLLARWHWPPFDLVSCCWVLADPHLPLQTPDEAEGEHSVYDRSSYRRSGGYPVLLGPGQSRAYVTVWPVIDVGWLQAIGPPLHLGPILRKNREGG